MVWCEVGVAYFVDVTIHMGRIFQKAYFVEYNVWEEPVDEEVTFDIITILFEDSGDGEDACASRVVAILNLNDPETNKCNIIWGE